jgi:hypothetical protein
MMRASRIAVLLFLALCWPVRGFAAGEARSLVILDVTAQMGAALGQKQKLEWAKASISATVNRLDPTSSFGLWAFGANPEKKCEGVTELAPLQASGAAQKTVEKALSALRPKAARAPAFGALEAALKSPGLADGKPMSAVFIGGTRDDCVKDVCAEAERLHGLYPNAKLTVLGLGMNDQAVASYTCAAKAMGGAFIAVKTGADLEKTLRQTLGVAPGAPQQKASAPATPVPGVAPAASAEAKPEPAQKAASGPSAVKAAPPEKAAPNEKAAAAEKSAPAVASAPAPKEQAPPPPVDERPAPPQPPLEPNVVLSAALTSGSPPLDAGVTWEIYKVQTTPTGQTRLAEAPLWVGGGGQAKAKLPEGRYSARATYGYATASEEFAVASGKVEKTVALEAGTVAVEALQTAGGAPAGGAFFTLYRLKAGGGQEELGRSSEAPALFHVNAGSYALLAVAGLAKVEAPVKAVAGKVSVARVAMNVGVLEIDAIAQEGARKTAPAWQHITPLGAEWRSVAAVPLRVFGGPHRLQLPAGTYKLETSYGGAREESTVTVAAGQTTSKTVNLNAGEAKLSLPPGKQDKICAVYEAGSNRKTPLDRAAGADIHFVLKAGRYEVDCRKKGETAPAKPTEITVVAGEVQSAKIED